VETARRNALEVESRGKSPNSAKEGPILIQIIFKLSK
jgi:hypothetical protein